MAGGRRKHGEGDHEGPASNSEPQNPASNAASRGAMILDTNIHFRPRGIPSFQPPSFAPLAPISHFDLGAFQSFQRLPHGLRGNSFDYSMPRLMGNAISYRDGASIVPQSFSTEMSSVGFPTLDTWSIARMTTESAAAGQEFPVAAGRYMSHLNPFHHQRHDGSSLTSTTNVPGGFSEFRNTTGGGFSGVILRADNRVTRRNVLPQPNTVIGQNVVGRSLDTCNRVVNRPSNTRNVDFGSNQMQWSVGSSCQPHQVGNFSDQSFEGNWPFSNFHTEVTTAGRQGARVHNMAAFPTSNLSCEAPNQAFEFSLSAGDKRTPLKQKQTGQALSIGHVSGPDQASGSQAMTSEEYKSRRPCATNQLERESREYRLTRDSNFVFADTCRRDGTRKPSSWQKVKNAYGSTPASISTHHPVPSLVQTGASSLLQTACHVAASLPSLPSQTTSHQKSAPPAFGAQFSPHQTPIPCHDVSAISHTIQTNSLPSVQSSQVRQRPEMVPIAYIERQGGVREGKECGHRCDLCEMDLSYAAEGDYVQPQNPPEVAVLPCGHCFHRTCLERITPDNQVMDPPCITCALCQD